MQLLSLWSHPVRQRQWYRLRAARQHKKTLSGLLHHYHHHHQHQQLIHPRRFIAWTRRKNILSKCPPPPITTIIIITTTAASVASTAANASCATATTIITTTMGVASAGLTAPPADSLSTTMDHHARLVHLSNMLYLELIVSTNAYLRRVVLWPVWPVRRCQMSIKISPKLN